ncbi:MAG: hypothetical protein NC453_21120, partial [Muribaculum sp.]|nr:hypothetical protein [Muribaculum sp.]
LIDSDFPRLHTLYPRLPTSPFLHCTNILLWVLEYQTRNVPSRTKMMRSSIDLTLKAQSIRQGDDIVTAARYVPRHWKPDLCPETLAGIYPAELQSRSSHKITCGRQFPANH